MIGPNGAGKTTLFNVVCGFVVPQTGSIVLDSREVPARNATTPRSKSARATTYDQAVEHTLRCSSTTSSRRRATPRQA